MSLYDGVMQKPGQVLIAAAIAQDYGGRDIDGRQPGPLTVSEA